MTGCVRGCTVPKRHLADCPVESYKTTAWVAADLEPGDRDQLFDGDAWLLRSCVRSRFHVGRYGGLEERRECPGCKPRDAAFGLICEQCHIRLTGWVSNKTSLSWAYFWLGKNLQPGQTSAARQDWQRSGGKTAPAALAIHIHDLRQEVAEEIAKYLAMLCGEFNLHGPDWFHHRVATAKLRAGGPGAADWHAWLPQNQAEVASACRYFTSWLDRIEDVPDLVIAMYEACDQVMRHTAAIAPWRGQAKTLRGIRCPECEHDALVVNDGDEHVTCRRCDVVISRKRYDIWTEMFQHQHAEAAS